MGEIAPGAKVTIRVGVKVFDSDIPKLPIQATVQPDLATVVDPSPADDHAELVTSVRAPITAEGIPDGCASKQFKVDVRDLDRGNHSLTIVAQANQGGPLATLKRKFKTC